MQKLMGVFIKGVPIAQPRPRGRVAYGNGKAFVKFYEGNNSNRKDGLSIKGWKMALEGAFNSLYPPEPLTGPLRVDCSFYFPRPAYAVTDSKYPDGPYFHDKVTDKDNLEKAVLDVMTTKRKGKITWPRFFDNDGQVCVGMVCKYVCARSPFHDYGSPGVHVRLWKLDPADNPHAPKGLL